MIFIYLCRMKTKEQVVRYTFRHKFSDNDWKKVLELCRKIYGSGIRRSIRPKSEQTYDGFVEWLDNGIGDGTIVNFNGDIGLLCDNSDGTYKFLAHYVNRKIVIEEVPVDINLIKIVTDGSGQFYKDLRKAGYQYNVTLATISKRPIPRKYSYTGFKIKDTEGFGLVGQCKGGVVNFLWCFDTIERRDYSVNLCDIDFYSLSKEQFVTIKSTMQKCGVCFDKETLQIIDTLPRVEIGKKYWFLTERFTLKQQVDNRLKKDNDRYENCNYFSTYKEAHIFRTKLMKIIKGRE